MTKANEQTEEMKDIQSEKDKEDHKKIMHRIGKEVF